MAQIDQFLIFGASIEYESFERFPSTPDSIAIKDEVREHLLSLGAHLPFRNYAVSGARIADLQANIDSYLANHVGAQNISCMIHIGGNNNSNNGQFSTWTQLQKDEFSDGLEEICQKVVAAGVDLILCPLTYRTNVDPAELNETLIYPLIQQYCPDWWDPVEQKPILDLYQISYDLGPTYFRDPVHTSYVGAQGLHQGVFDVLFDSATMPAWDGRETFSFNACDVYTRPAGTNGSTDANVTIYDLINTENKIVPGSFVTASGFMSGRTAFLPGTEGNISQDALGYQPVGRCRYAGTSPATVRTELGAEYAGKTGQVQVTATRYSDSPNNNRVTIVTIGDVSEEIDAEANPPDVVLIPVTLDAAGGFTIQVAPAAGASNSYFSAYDLFLDSEDDPVFEITDSPESIRRGSSFSVTGTGITSEPTATLSSEPLSVIGYTPESIELEVPANTLAGHGENASLAVSVGESSQTLEIDFFPAAGFAFVNLVDPVGGPGTIFEGMINADTSDPISPVTGGQVIYSEMTSGGASAYPVTVRPDGWPEIDTGGATLDGSELFTFQYLAPGEAISNSATVSLSDYLEPFEFTGSGGITVGGTADLFHAFAATGSGGITVGGSAEYSFPTAEPFEFTGTGGLVFSGSADYSGPTVAPFDFTGSGGLRVGGSSDIDTGGVTILPASGLVVIIDTSDQIIQSADRPLDPYDTEWVVFAWDNRIADAAVISSEWVVPTDWNLVRTAQNQEISARGREFQSVNAALVDVNNAQPGRYVVSNRVHLSDGRQFERSVKIQIKEM